MKEMLQLWLEKEDKARKQRMPVLQLLYFFKKNNKYLCDVILM